MSKEDKKKKVQTNLEDTSKHLDDTDEFIGTLEKTVGSEKTSQSRKKGKQIWSKHNNENTDSVINNPNNKRTKILFANNEIKIHAKMKISDNTARRICKSGRIRKAWCMY